MPDIQTDAVEQAEKPAARKSFFIYAQRLFPLLLAILFSLGLFSVTLHHEMWRDEVQAWLLARDSSDLASLMTNIKYEGHTGLWHTILWLVTRFTADPFWMQVVHVLIAGCSAFLLFRYAPFPAPVRVLVPFGYFLFYEWGVVSRNYGISALLLFTMCACYRDRWKRFPLIGAFIFLLCHTNIYGIIISAVLAAAWAVEYAVSYAGKYRDAEKYLIRVLAGFILISAGLISSIQQITPPEDTGFAEKWRTRWEQSTFERTSMAVFNAFLPLPSNDLQFWSGTRVLKHEQNNEKDWIPYVMPERRVGLSLLIMGISCLFFFKRPWLIVPLCIGYLGMLAFMYIKLYGAFRHHGLMYLYFIVMLWMSHEYTPWRLPSKLMDWPFAMLDKFRCYLLVPLLLLHICGMWTAVIVDWNQTFTNATDAARWLNEKYPDKTGIVFAGDYSPEVSAVVGNMGLDRIYYTDRNDFGSYVIWDNCRQSAGDWHLARAMRRILSDGAKHVVLILSYKLTNHNMPDGFVYLQSFDKPATTSEQYHIYKRDQ